MNALEQHSFGVSVGFLSQGGGGGYPEARDREVFTWESSRVSEDVVLVAII